MPDKKFLKYSAMILVLIVIIILVYFFFSEDFFTKQLEKTGLEDFATFGEDAPGQLEKPETPLISPQESIMQPIQLLNDVPGAEICPCSLEVGYLVDYKQTTTTKDDDVYLVIKNNNQMPENIKIKIDDLDEGSLEVKGLGTALKKSLMMTNWWRILFISSEKEFAIQMTPRKCLPILIQVKISYPPAKGDEYD